MSVIYKSGKRSLTISSLTKTANKDQKLENCLRLIAEGYDINHFTEIRFLVVEELRNALGLDFDFSDFVDDRNTAKGTVEIDNIHHDVIVWESGGYSKRFALFTTDYRFIGYGNIYDFDWHIVPDFYARLCLHSCRHCGERHDVRLATEDSKSRTVNWDDLNYGKLTHYYINKIKQEDECYRDTDIVRRSQKND